ncbi:peptide deformylase [Leptolyngbya cf. ectocarpi LEGE 11479]|uniref:Peptide deformylase n=1 Tax=Leptolyngbya cf. ectocarpi LEGE 11479 TaxID=1828722 RepID=A0A928WXM4_LEPEC|nr:peptide deformylase [Leptolyngbya ectocarpi]MBE9065227.1 peptide deformylase [Leptolyngbya cf. ectocarpi LEGE 11479]
MAICSVIELGDERLRSHAQPIRHIDDPQQQVLIDDLLATAAAKNGVGIAAPQIAQGLQLFIVASRPNPRYPQAPEMEPTAMINPQLLSHSDDQVQGWEGCLSVPGQRGLVPRYREIEVAYLDRYGQHHRQHLQGFVARIFQHEYDHLQGIVFLDRVLDPQNILTEAEYQQRFG